MILTMRNLLLTVLAFCTASGIAYGQVPHAGFQGDSSAIVSIAQRLMDAIGVGDTTVWIQYLHPEYMMRGEDGMLKRKHDVLAEIRPLPKGYEGTIHVTGPLVVNQGNTYVLNFIADERLNLYGQTIQTSYAVMDTYVKTGSGWLSLASEIFEMPADPPRIQVKDWILQSYTGMYQLADSVEYHVRLENGKLMGQRTGRAAAELLPETESMFFVAGQRGRKIFMKDDMGKVVKMIDRRSGHDLVWTKTR